MSKKQYTKPPLPLDEQAQLLLDRGLKGISKEELIQYLAFKRKHHIVNNKKVKILGVNSKKLLILCSK